MLDPRVCLEQLLLCGDYIGLVSKLLFEERIPKTSKGLKATALNHRVLL